MLGVLVVTTALVALRLTAVSKVPRHTTRLRLAIAGVALWAGQAGVVIRKEVCGIARFTVVVLSARSLLNEHSIRAGTLPGLTCLVPEEVPGIARAAVVILGA